MQNAENKEYVWGDGLRLSVQPWKKRNNAVLGILVFGSSETEMLKTHLEFLQRQDWKGFDVLLLLTSQDDVDGIGRIAEELGRGFNIIMSIRGSPDGYGCGGGFYLAQRFAVENGYEIFVAADIDALPVGTGAMKELVAGINGGKSIMFSVHDNTNLYAAYATKIFGKVGYVSPLLFYCGEDIEFRERIRKMLPESAIGHIGEPVRHPFDNTRPDEDLKEKSQTIKTQFFKRYLVLRNVYYTFAECPSIRLAKKFAIHVLETTCRGFFLDSVWHLRAKWLLMAFSDLTSMRFGKGMFSDEAVNREFFDAMARLYPAKGEDTIPDLKGKKVYVNMAHFTEVEMGRIREKFPGIAVVDYRKSIAGNINFEPFLLVSKHSSALFINPITLLKKRAYLFNPDDGSVLEYKNDAPQVIRIFQFLISTHLVAIFSAGMFGFLAILGSIYNQTITGKFLNYPKD